MMLLLEFFTIINESYVSSFAWSAQRLLIKEVIRSFPQMVSDMKYAEYILSITFAINGILILYDKTKNLKNNKNVFFQINYNLK